MSQETREASEELERIIRETSGEIADALNNLAAAVLAQLLTCVVDKEAKYPDAAHIVKLYKIIRQNLEDSPIVRPN